VHKKPMLIERSQWAMHDYLWRGRFEGKSVGTDVTVLFFASDELGAGAALHVHPYDEVFIIRSGRARFTIGKETFEASAGQILFGPAGVPHKFSNLGPGRLETTDIHLSSEFIQTNLEDPDVLTLGKG
jgi:mannose-6-phosphate isomerase-like protein (cupin superfamily)